MRWFWRALEEIVALFKDEVSAQKWLSHTRGPKGIRCPVCQFSRISERKNRCPCPFRCRDCHMDSSVKTNSVMHKSKLSLRQWSIAIYLLTTSLKGVSSMRVRRELKITQKIAWYLGHRIRLVFERAATYHGLFQGPVEIDETYVGGSNRNRHES